MHALVMRGVVVTGMIMVMLVFACRRLCIAHYECKSSIHLRQHEAHRNERPKEQQPEDEQYCPSGILNAPHPLHPRQVLSMKCSFHDGVFTKSRNPRESCVSATLIIKL
ncbi:MAG: hypothetical protein ABSF86_21765 [Steroidobacteraceae bacterium]|jgi:hypothetical protein